MNTKHLFLKKLLISYNLKTLTEMKEWVSGLNHTVANGINSQFLIIPFHTFKFLLVKLINKHRTN